MKETILQAARDILHVNLTEEQVVRCIKSAAADASQWMAEADADQLPPIATLHLDWSLDADLKDAGVLPRSMQSLSFMIARANAKAKAIEALAAL